jgi:hypothetical protein
LHFAYRSSSPCRGNRFVSSPWRQDRSWGGPRLLSNEFREFFLLVQSGQDEKLTTHLHLAATFKNQWCCGLSSHGLMSRSLSNPRNDFTFYLLQFCLRYFLSRAITYLKNTAFFRNFKSIQYCAIIVFTKLRSYRTCLTSFFSHLLHRHCYISSLKIAAV